MRRCTCSRLAALCCCVAIVCILSLIVVSLRSDRQQQSASRAVIVVDETVAANERNGRCTWSRCADVQRCGLHRRRLSVYVYPLAQFVYRNGSAVPLPLPSREFLELRRAVERSGFFEPDSAKACIAVPPVDTLNLDRADVSVVSAAVASLPGWKRRGQNHLLFVMIGAARVSSLASGDAVVAASGLSAADYRPTHDVAIPLYNPLTDSAPDVVSLVPRRHTLVALRSSLSPSTIAALSPAVLLLGPCSDTAEWSYRRRCDHRGNVVDFPEVLKASEYCLITGGAQSELLLMDALRGGCIPAIVGSAFVLPFSEVLDWSLISLRVNEEDVLTLLDRLASESERSRVTMREQIEFVWRSYMADMDALVGATLELLEARFLPHRARSLRQWNGAPPVSANPFFLPRVAADDGFTAVVLTYNRPAALLRVVERLAQCRSLRKVVVVWNDPLTAPPPKDVWPKIVQPIHVMRMKENLLSNRFKVFSAIETEAVFSVDDDIAMLSADELDFAYQVWREFPSQLVGFPSRVHLYDAEQSLFRYSSEWTNNVSMVLTGAAFYHKYYGHLYETRLPRQIHDYVELQKNCEDIAMNFLVANATGAPPIKVTPRKRFVCAACAAAAALSADNAHLLVRSHCVDYFARVYGHMPLRSAQFRVDPAQFKAIDAPLQLLRFPNVGSL